MHHQRFGARVARGLRQCDRIVDAAPNAADQHGALGIVLGRGMHHRFRFLGGEAVELAGVAVRHQRVHAGAHGALDDRLEPRGREPVLRIERRDKNAGDAGEGLSQSGSDHGSV